ncbi:hypothetical protein J4E91_006702 [Alternaria rosae]|nr:hypothetical protein J4E91_006702 [Alternaria rosae]
MVDMEPASDQYKRQKLGFEESVAKCIEATHADKTDHSYSDSKVLSDITIRYGALGERTFEAHRILLSAKAYWFKAAFTGQFAESSAREITLKEDDSDALLTMLNFAYDQKIPPPDDSSSGTPLNIRHCLHLYRVGDKYDYPQFRDQAVSLFKCSMVVSMADLEEDDWEGYCPRCGEHQLDWRPAMLCYEEEKFIEEGTQSK